MTSMLFEPEGVGDWDTSDTHFQFVTLTQRMPFGSYHAQSTVPIDAVGSNFFCSSGNALWGLSA